VQAGAAPGDYTVSVLGQAQVPFNKDPKAAKNPNTLVSLPVAAADRDGGRREEIKKAHRRSPSAGLERP